MYVHHTVEILREIRRVLRKDGVVFWNIGDSYASQGGPVKSSIYDIMGGSKPSGYEQSRTAVHSSIKPLDLCLIPERLAIVLQMDNWWVRSIIIWHKANPMPESINGWRWEQHRVLMWPDGTLYKQEKGKPRPEEVEMQDCPGCPKCLPNDGLVLRKGSWRPTDSYEQILMLTKTDNYYCDAEAVREAQTGNAHSRGTEACNEAYQEARGSYYGFISPAVELPNGRNLRNVWAFPTVPFPGAHFAVFPEKLPELCIKAATPEVGVCAKCGAPWARVVESKQYPRHETEARDLAVDRNGAQRGKHAQPTESTTLGWRPTCSCNCPDKVPATVLDPFAGAGTTLKVAIKLGRSAVGYEISSQYCDMINKRIDKVQIRYSQRND